MTAAEAEKAERAAAAKSEFDRIQAERAALPMYPYREQILQALALPCQPPYRPSLRPHCIHRSRGNRLSGKLWGT
eukprot:scaffold366652_cov31-Prasinocladus_malaysianus.AAC.2